MERQGEITHAFAWDPKYTIVLFFFLLIIERRENID